MLETVSQASLTNFTTYLPVKAPVKLTNLSICARFNPDTPLTQKSRGIRTKRPEKEQNLGEGVGYNRKFKRLGRFCWRCYA